MPERRDGRAVHLRARYGLCVGGSPDIAARAWLANPLRVTRQPAGGRSISCVTGSSTDDSALAAAKARAHDLETQLAQVRAERDAAAARLDDRERRKQIGGAARRISVGILVGLAALLIPITVTMTWAHRTVLNTDSYVSTVTPIAKDPVVTAALARIATNQLFAALDPQQTIADALPPKAAFLAGPITNGVKGFIQDQANNALNTEQFQQLWVTANRTAHAELMKVLHGDSKALSTSNGQVVLSVVPLLNQILQNAQQTISGITGKSITLPQLTGNELPSVACAKISAALNRPLPDTCGQIPLFTASKLKEAQRAVRAFDRVVILLLILTPLIAIGALALSRRRRRTLLQIVVGTMLVMVILRRAVMWLQNDLIKTGRPENTGARRVIVHQLLHAFFTASVWVLVIAAAIVALALLTGPYGWAVKLRGWVRSGAVATVRVVRDAASGDQAAGVWVRGHLDLLRIGGGLVALLLILVFDISFVWLLVILALLAGVRVLAVPARRRDRDCGRYRGRTIRVTHRGR